DPRGWHYELRNGEPFLMPPPKHDHKLVMRRIFHDFEAATDHNWIVDFESGYRATSDYEYWEADVMVLSKTRWDAIPKNGNQQGPPDLVVEILSPSNTAAEIARKRKICLANGTREFWVVSSRKRTVEVFTPDGSSVTDRSGEQIALFFAPGKSIAVDAIFADI